MILIVDDDPGTSQLLARLLAKSGYQTQTRNCGSDLLAGLQERPPSLVILDMMMPRVSGMVCLEAIRSHPQWERVPVLVYSADDTPARIEEALNLGAQDYIVKGRLRWNEMLAVIERYAN